MNGISRWSTPLLALLVLLLSAPARAEVIDSKSIESDLQSLYTSWKDRDGGWTLLPAFRVIDSAEEYDEANITLQLIRGVKYKIVGKCDEYCSDMALVLSDSKGTVVSKGNAGFLSTPLDFVAPVSGQYSLNISMDACDDYFCDYGVDVYRAGLAKATTPQAPAPVQPTPVPPAVVKPVTPAPAATGGNDDQARKNLQARYEYWKDRDSGWTLLPASRAIGSTKEGYAQNVTVTLSAGVTYKIMGACDDSCTNLDLKVVDAAGTRLASDVDKDSIPILNLTPAASGTFTVTATMAGCKQTNGCSYGVDVYQAVQAAAPQPAVPVAVAAPASTSEAQARSNLDDRFKYWSDSYTIFPNSRAISQLLSGQTVDIRVKDFKAGVALQLMGACDNDCSTLTLELRDAAGKLIRSDTSTLAIPRVDLTPSGAGDYVLTVKMDRCARPAGCTFGVEVYQAK